MSEEEKRSLKGAMEVVFVGGISLLSGYWWVSRWLRSEPESIGVSGI